MQKRRNAKIRQDMLDREASLARAKTPAALAEGSSWGMSEDAPEEFGEVSCLLLATFEKITSFLKYFSS